MVTKRSQTDGVSRGFNINDFRSYRDQAGILRNHDFHVEIPMPLGLLRTPTHIEVNRNLELVAESINFPATGHVNYQVARYSYGALQTKPTIPRFSPLECTFVIDRQSNVWRFMHDWVRLCVNFDFARNPTATGLMEIYEISYEMDYVVDMFLYIYSPTGDLVRKVGFRHAYPIMVADVPLAWGAGNQLIKINVTFTFVDWVEIVVPAMPLEVPVLSQGFGPTEPEPVPGPNPTNTGPGLG